MTDESSMLKIGILPGDDIGLEVVSEAVKVMRSLRRYNKKNADKRR